MTSDSDPRRNGNERSRFVTETGKRLMILFPGCVRLRSIRIVLGHLVSQAAWAGFRGVDGGGRPERPQSDCQPAARIISTRNNNVTMEIDLLLQFSPIISIQEAYVGAPIGVPSHHRFCGNGRPSVISDLLRQATRGAAPFRPAQVALMLPCILLRSIRVMRAYIQNF